ncbi:MAG: hypothetical protein ACRCTJ_06480 [Brevinema sp.]
MKKNLSLLIGITLTLLHTNSYTQPTPQTLPNLEVPVTPSQFLVNTKPSPTASALPLLQKQFRIPQGMFPNPIGVSLIYNYTKEKYKIKKFKGEAGPALESLLGSGLQNWGISKGTIDVESHAVGAKVDIMLLPFLQLFGLAAYLQMNQRTDIGTATVTLNIPPLLGGPKPLGLPVGVLENKLEGFVGMAGINLAFGYKGFFTSFMLSGGYVRLDDKVNNITRFVEKPIMYVAPRIGYQYKGIFNVYTGIQYVELFGATKGKDLSVLTGGLVKSYSVEIEKFPVNFVAGMQFYVSREFVISLEYVGSPDSSGVNMEIGARF